MSFSDSYLEHWKTGLAIALLLHAAVVLFALYGPDLLKFHKKKEEIYSVKLFAPTEQTVKSKESPAPMPAKRPPVLPRKKEMAATSVPKPVNRPKAKVTKPPLVKKTEPVKPKSVEQKKIIEKPKPKPPVEKAEKKSEPPKKAVSLKPEKKKVAKPKPKPVKKKPVKKAEKKVSPNPVKKPQGPSQEEILKKRLAAIKAQIKARKEEKLLEERLKALREQVRKDNRNRTAQAPGAAVSGTGKAKSVNEVIMAYGSKVSSEIWRRWNLPTSLIDQKGLEAVIEIKIADDGTILSRRFEKTSGDMLFDRSAMRAVKEASPVTPLPPQLRPGPLVMGIRFRPEGM